MPCPALQVRPSASPSAFPPAHPIQPQNRSKCQDLQLGPLFCPSWVPARGREAAGRLGERGEGCPPPAGTQWSQTQPRWGAGDFQRRSRAFTGLFAENIKLGKRRANPGVIPPPCRPSPPSCLVSFVPICPAGFSLICHVPGRASTGEGEREPDGERMGGSQPWGG